MTALIPEKRPDKNGQTVTRWVKPPFAPGNTSSIPAPIVSDQGMSTDRKREAIKETLVNVAHEFGDEHTRFLDDANKGTIDYLHDTLMRDDIHGTYLPGQISCLLNDNVEDEVMIAYIALYDIHDGVMDDMMEVDYLRGALNSGPKREFDRHNTEDMKGTAALFKFLSHADYEKFVSSKPVEGITTNGIPASSCQIADRDLGEYVYENPDRVDDLISMSWERPEMIMERDKSGIEMIMGEASNWTPVSDGAL